MRLRCLIAGLLAACSMAAQAGPADAQLAQADKHWAEGRYEPAQKAFEAAVAADPASPAVRMRLAGFLLSRQQYSAAIGHYQKIIGGNSKNALAWIGLGMAYLHLGQYEPARGALDEAIRLEPGRKEKLAPLLAKLEARHKVN